MEDEIQSNPFEIVLSLKDHKLVDGKVPALRFTVVISTVNGINVITIPGWRVWKGRVLPPARQDRKKFWVDVVEQSRSTEDLLTKMVQGWRKQFPTVTFPEVEQITN